MNRATVASLAVSSAFLAVTAIGCKPASDARPMAISASAPPSALRKAAKLADAASTALAKHKPAVAVARAEQAVALAPQDAGYRALLGKTYLASGRFLSAEAALTDALTLAPDDGPALLNLSLTQIALGKWDIARQTLTRAQGHVPEADRGLAFALAGQPDVAVTMLEPLARAAGADAKTRQNLALSYALSGHWAEAQATAMQDLAPAEADRRIQQWALFAKPRAVSDQVATLLKVTPARDPGLPPMLALAPAAATVQSAAAEPAGAAPADQAAPVVAEAAPVAADQVAAVALPASAAVPVAPAVADAATPAEIAPAPSAVAVEPVFYAPPSAGHDAPLLRAERTPIRQPMLVARRDIKKPAFAPQTAAGGWAVQLGAYASRGIAETAWSRVSGRMRMLANYAPSHSSYDRYQRLALSGFARRADATAVCRRVKIAGGVCFVRAVSGDRPVEMVAAKPPVRVASR